ncbi:MAG: vWA domain-containing protein [Calditrichia bacterium]
MFLKFFLLLKEDGLPVSMKELLTFLEALNEDVIDKNVDDFYYLARSIFVKHEQHLDRFDVLFGRFFAGLDNTDSEKSNFSIPEDWLKRKLMRHLTDEEKDAIKALGGPEELMKRFKELMDEQKKRHEGGNKWIGTGGTSPFGSNGYNPEGYRLQNDGKGNGRAVKMWQQRDYRNLDDSISLNTRNMKMVLKRLRVLTREGREEELDIDRSIRKTSDNAGLLEIEMMPTRRNNVKVLLFFDVGGSMDEHIETCEQLFSAARHQFKHLEFYYFHNCVYESLWKDNSRRRFDKTSTYRMLNTYNKDYKVIFVGDASMSPYELFYAGGSIEHMNEEPGAVWLERICEHFENVVWLNPLPPDYWRYSPTVEGIQELLGYRMFPLSLGGLQAAMKALQKKNEQNNSVE